jgi:hypothetical protein
LQASKEVFFYGTNMTETQATVLDILTMISDWRGETQTNSDASRIRAVSRAEKDFSKRMFWRTHLLRNQTMAGTGSADYTIGSSTLPMRTKGLAEVFVGGTSEGNRVQVVDFTEFKVIVNSNSSARVAYEWYDATNDLWKVHINPTPAVTDTITYSYFWQPPQRTSTADIVVCPNMEIIAHGALAEIFDSEDELQKALNERQLVEQMIDEVVALEESPAVGQIYQMKASENQTAIRGIGSY